MTTMDSGVPAVRLGVPAVGWVLKAGWRYVRLPREAALLGQPDACHLVQYLNGMSTRPSASCGKRFVFSHWSHDGTYATFKDYDTDEYMLSFTKLQHHKMIEELCPMCYAKLEQHFHDGLLVPMPHRRESLF